MVGGCPMAEESTALKLIERMEQMREQLNWKLSLLKGEVIAKITPSYEEVMLRALKEFYVDVPDHILAKLVVSQDFGTERLPWNRRRRRTIERARKIHVHLFSGDGKKWWDLEEDVTVVICIDKVNDPAQDLHNDDVCGYMRSLAKSGKVISIFGGPPCRTVSACRARQPGPRQVRSEQHPYGLPRLTPQEKETVEGDSVLWLRMMTRYVVAEEIAGRQGNGTVGFVKEQLRDCAGGCASRPTREFMAVRGLEGLCPEVSDAADPL